MDLAQLVITIPETPPLPPRFSTIIPSALGIDTSPFATRALMSFKFKLRTFPARFSTNHLIEKAKNARAACAKLGRMEDSFQCSSPFGISNIVSGSITH